MFCTKCGIRIDDDSSFCDKCGAKVNYVNKMAIQDESPKVIPNENSQTNSRNDKKMWDEGKLHFFYSYTDDDRRGCLKLIGYIFLVTLILGFFITGEAPIAIVLLTVSAIIIILRRKK